MRLLLVVLLELLMSAFSVENTQLIPSDTAFWYPADWVVITPESMNFLGFWRVTRVADYHDKSDESKRGVPQDYYEVGDKIYFGKNIILDSNGIIIVKPVYSEPTKEYYKRYRMSYYEQLIDLYERELPENSRNVAVDGKVLRHPIFDINDYGILFSFAMISDNEINVEMGLHYFLWLERV